MNANNILYETALKQFDTVAEMLNIEDIQKKLKDVMVGTFNRVLALANKKGVDMRTAALMLGIGRVAEAKKMRGLYP